MVVSNIFSYWTKVSKLSLTRKEESYAAWEAYVWLQSSRPVLQGWETTEAQLLQVWTTLKFGNMKVKRRDVYNIYQSKQERADGETGTEGE